MNISENAQRTTETVFAALGIEPDEAQKREVTRRIERGIVDAVLSESERCTQVVMDCCSADMDMAHKLAAEIRASSGALVANLSSMR